MRMGHKGFSLVEVIVSLAIMTIVGGAISAFLIAGNNSYIRGNRDLTLQEETQLTTNQMIDLIIDVQNDIRTQATTGSQYDNSGNVLSGTSVDVKELILYNDESVMMLRWQGGSGENANEVFLLETENKWVDDAGNEVAEGTDGAKIKYGDITAEDATVTRSLLAQYVKDFDVDLSELDKRKVKLNLTFEVEGKEYKVSETIKLRNDFNKSNATEYYWITSIDITPTPVTLTQGEVVQFTCTMTGDQGAIDEGVTWSCERVDGEGLGDNGKDLAGDTKRSVGNMTFKLTIGKSEPVGGNGGEGYANAAIKVTAKSVADPNKYAEAWVSVKEPDITSIYIVPGTATMMQGDELEFECVIEGQPEIVERGVSNWTVEANNREVSVDTTITPIGEKKMKATLHVADDQLIGTNAIKITAQSAAVSSSAGRAEAYISVNKKSSIAGLYDVKLIATNLTYYELDSNGALGYMATIECLTSYADYANGYPYITWEETTLGSQAYTLVDEPTETDSYTGYKTPNYVTNLYCGTQSNTIAHVQATVLLDGEGNSCTVGIDITIPAIEKTVDPTSIYIDSDNFVLYRGGSVNLTLKGVSDNIKDSQVTWEIDNLDEYSELKNIATLGAGSSYRGSVNAVGFGKVTGAYMGNNGNNENYLNPTGTGISTVMNANSLNLISLSNEYRLKVVAKIDGVEVASTNVLLPRFDFTFPNGKRYMTIDAPSIHTSPEGRIPISIYGVAVTSEIGLSDDLQITWTAEKAFAANTWLASPSYYMVTKDRFDLSFQIGADEQNDMIILTIIDPSIGEDSRRNLVFYVNYVGHY